LSPGYGTEFLAVLPIARKMKPPSQGPPGLV
jgi:hypothetical protein